jgi:HK97 family phage portal protein
MVQQKATESSVATDIYGRLFSTLGGGVRRTLAEMSSNDKQMPYKEAVAAYNNSVWVYRCIKAKADAIASVPWIAVDMDMNREPGHPLEVLMNTPNRHSARNTFNAELSVQLDLAGQNFLEIVFDKKKPWKLYNLRPDFCTPIPDPIQFISGFLVNPTGQKKDERPVDVENMIWIHEINPLNPYLPQSPMTVLRDTIMSDTAMQDWNDKLLERNAIPGGILHIPQNTMEESEVEAVKRHLMKEFSGVNKLLPMIAWGGMKWEQLGLKPDELQAMNKLELNKFVVCGILGTPGELVGAVPDPTYANRKAARTWWWQDILVPRLDLIATAITQKTAAYFNDGVRIVPDLSRVPALQEVLGEKIDQAEKLWALGYPINVLNESLTMGLPEIEGGDIGYLPSNVIPASLSAPDAAGDGSGDTTQGDTTTDPNNEDGAQE